MGFASKLIYAYIHPNSIKSPTKFKIKRYIDNDGIVFGGSAGAIIFGKDIDTCKYEDDNSIIGLKDKLSELNEAFNKKNIEKK